MKIKAILCSATVLLLVAMCILLFQRGKSHDKLFGMLWFASAALWILGQELFSVFSVAPAIAAVFLLYIAAISFLFSIGHRWAQPHILWASAASVLFNAFIAWFFIGQTMWFHENERLPYSFTHLLDGYFILMACIGVLSIAFIFKKRKSEPTLKRTRNTAPLRGTL